MDLSKKKERRIDKIHADHSESTREYFLNLERIQEKTHQFETLPFTAIIFQVLVSILNLHRFEFDSIMPIYNTLFHTQTKPLRT